MNVALRANRLSAKRPGCIDHRAEEQHPLLKQSALALAPNVHGDAVHRVGPAALRIAKAGPNRIQTPHFMLWTKDARAVLKRKAGL
jgi:hypothetical protein